MSAPRVIRLSDGSSYVARAEVWDDLHTERAGCYRAFWVCEDGTSGTPVIGYCSPGGSHRTIRATVAELHRMYPGEPVWRNGRRIA